MGKTKHTVTKERRLCQISLSHDDLTSTHYPGRKRIPTRKKEHRHEAAKQGSLEATEEQGRKMCKKQMRIQARHARPCTPMNNFKSSEQREATEGSAQEAYRQHHSGCNTDFKSWCMPVQSLQADLITLLKIHEVHSHACIYTHRKKAYSMK